MNETRKTDKPAKGRGRKGTGWLIPPRDEGGIWHCGYKYKGRRYRWSSHSPLKTDAIAALDRAIPAIRAGTWRPAGKPDVPATVGSVADRWLELYAKVVRDEKGHTLARARVARFLKPFLGSIRAQDVSSDNLRSYRFWLSQQKRLRRGKDGRLVESDRPLSTQTQRHVLSDCRCAMLWAGERGLVPRGIVPKRFLPKAEERPVRSLSREQQDAVRVVEDPYGFAVRVMLDAGVRWSELCRLSREDLADGELVVHGKTKSRRMRSIPIPPALVAEIQRHVGKLVPFERKDASWFARAVRLRSGVEEFSAHKCRHSFAFNYMRSGGNVVVLQALLGHESIGLTAHYARPSREAIRADAEKVHLAS